MEIKPTSKNNLNLNKPHSSFQKKNSKESCNENKKGSQECLGSMGKAQVLMQNKSFQTPESEEEIMTVLKKIVEPKGMKIGICYGLRRINIGRPFANFPDLCQDDMRATCRLDEKGKLLEILILEHGGINNRGTVGIYSANGILDKYFSPEDMNALHEYKYTPEPFHLKLRENKERGLQTKEELQSWIDTIDNMFKDETKSFETNDTTIVYRALPDKLSFEQIDALSKIGGIFKEMSYSSTSQKYETARRFQRYSPILEIEIPKGFRYIDLDKLFNIDRERWREQEMLLPRGCEFEVTGYDEIKNVVKVKLIQ